MQNPQELIIVDGGSKDGTWEWLQKNVTKAVQTQCRRANQMNIDVTRATSNNLFFLHADSRVPIHFDALLIEAQKKGIESACFQLQFDAEN